MDLLLFSGESEESRLRKACILYVDLIHSILIKPGQQKEKDEAVLYLNTKLIRLAIALQDPTYIDQASKVTSCTYGDILRSYLESQEWIGMESLVHFLQSTLHFDFNQIKTALDKALYGGLTVKLSPHLMVQNALETGHLLGLDLSLRFFNLDRESRNVRNSDGQTILHVVCMDEETKIDKNFLIKYLLDQGLDPSLKDTAGKLAADYITSDGINQTVLSHLKNGLDSGVKSDLAFMSSAKVEGFLLNRICCDRQLKACDVGENLTFLPAEEKGILKEEVGKKGHNAAWKCLLTELWKSPDGILDLCLILEQKYNKKELAKIVEEVYNYIFLNAQVLNVDLPETMQIQRNWSTLEDLISKKCSPEMVSSLSFLSSTQIQKITAMLPVDAKPLSSQDTVGEYLLKYALCYRPSPDKSIQELLAKCKDFLPEVLVKLPADVPGNTLAYFASEKYECLKEVGWTRQASTSNTLPSSPAKFKKRRRRTSSRPSHCETEEDLPQSPNDYEKEIIDKVTTKNNSIIYMPVASSQSVIASAVVQKFLWHWEENDPSSVKKVDSSGSILANEVGKLKIYQQESPVEKKKSERDESPYRSHRKSRSQRSKSRSRARSCNLDTLGILVVTGKEKDVDEVCTKLKQQLQHLRVIDHGGEQTARSGIEKLLTLSDIVVTNVSSVSNSLDAKSLPLKKLKLIVFIGIGQEYFNSFEKCVVEIKQKGGSHKQKGPTVVSLVQDWPLSDIDAELSDVIRNFKKNMNNADLIFVEECSEVLYKNLCQDTKLISTQAQSNSTNSQNFPEEGTFQTKVSHMVSCCYGYYEYISAAVLSVDCGNPPKELVESIKKTLPCPVRVHQVDNACNIKKSSKNKEGNVYFISNGLSVVDRIPPWVNFVCISVKDENFLTYGEKVSDLTKTLVIHHLLKKSV